MALENLLRTRFEDLLTGKKKAYELPEFQSMREMLEQTGATTRAGTARTMRTMGIKGPSVGMTLQKQQEQELAPIGPAMTGVLSKIPEQAMGMRGQDIQKELGLGQLREMRKGRHLQERMAKSPSAACVLTTVCYGENSPVVLAVRTLRDAMKDNPVAKKIIRGYYVFSDLLLPLIETECMKGIVRVGLVEPLIRMVIRKFGGSIRPWLTPIDRGISFLALSLWKIMGSRGVYTRRNGEKV